MTYSTYLSIGLMSGTSMDGIDVSLLKTNGECYACEISSHHFSYDSNTKILLKALERSVRNVDGDMQKAKANYVDEVRAYLVEELHWQSPIAKAIIDLTAYLQENINTKCGLSLDAVIKLSTLLHAKVVDELLRKVAISANDIDLIGYHGQTVYHNPNKKITIQIGDGELLSKLTSIMVVDNFRSQDVENGGQGAPFAPIYHQILAGRDKQIPAVVVNCGGISNLSIIPSMDVGALLAFDSGPGNGLVDAFIKKRTNGAELIDKNGKYGLLGQVNFRVLEELFAKSICLNGENYLLKHPPKSLDIRDLQLIDELDLLSIEDGAATLEVFTADSIIASLDLIDINIPKHWILTGGGWKNPVIRKRLEMGLQEKYGGVVKINHADTLNWNSASLEAQVFAYLAVRSFKSLPLSFPGMTGVSLPTRGGVLHNFL